MLTRSAFCSILHVQVINLRDQRERNPGPLSSGPLFLLHHFEKCKSRLFFFFFWFMDVSVSPMPHFVVHVIFTAEHFSEPNSVEGGENGRVHAVVFSTHGNLGSDAVVCIPACKGSSAERS